MKVFNYKSIQNKLALLYTFKEKHMAYIRWGIFLVWFIMSLHKSFNQVPTVVYNTYYMDCDSAQFAVFKQRDNFYNGFDNEFNDE